MAAAAGCSIPDEPVLPQWQFSLVRIPIMGPDTIDIGAELANENLVAEGADSLFHIKFEGSEQIGISEQLKQEAVNPAPFSGSIGNFAIGGNSGQTVTIGITEAFPFLAGQGGSSIPIPSGALPRIEKPITLNNFSEVTFVSGDIGIQITNNLNFVLGKPINIELFDVGNNATVDAVVFSGTISANGGTAQQSFDLSGKTMSNNLKVIITGNEDGTGINPVTINENLSFTIEVSMSNLVASSATANIPDQNFSISQSVDVGTDSFRVISADITSGSIVLDFTSEFPFPIQMDVELTDITTSPGNPISTIITIPANSSSQSMISLANTTMSLGDGNMDFGITVSTQSGNQTFTVNATDAITTTVSVTKLVFSSVTADINVGTDFPSFEKQVIDLDFDVPDIKFDDMIFTLIFVDNPVNLDITLNLTGKKSGKSDVQANYSFSLIGGIDNTVVINNTGITVNGASSGSGSGLADVINLLPETIFFSGSAQINFDNATLTNQPITINYTVDIAFIFSIPSGAVLEGDTIKISFDSENPKDDKDIRDILRDFFKGGSLDFTLANGIPIGGELSLHVADTLTAQSADPASWPVLISFHFDGAETDPLTGDITGMPDQEISVGITEAQVKILADSYFAFWFVTLDPVIKGSLHSTDKIFLRKSFLSGEITVNTDLFDKFEDIGDKGKGGG
ncbi:hypothetical protein IID62_04250 [candidate division KSB1 bacterium]|nr:hypothetical protein [candidate division KSB1 bacterium]